MKRAIETLQALTTLPVSAAILDTSGTIIAVNDTWREFGRRNGLRMSESGIGANYLQYCGSDDVHPSRFASALKDLLAGRRELLTTVYPCHSPNRKRWFSLIALPLSSNKPTGVALLHVNLTDTIPVPIGGPSTPATKERKKATDKAADMNAVGGAIERSVLETITSQLSDLLSDRNAGIAKSAPPSESEQIVASAGLSKRQMQILRLLGEGKTNKEIAQALFRSPHTIKLHVSAILQRLNLKSRTQAALIASRLYREDLPDEARDAAKPWKKAPHTVA